MNLTFAEDFTTDVVLDSELMGTSDSGYYWNRGVHPTLTIDNLVTFLPNKTLTFAAYAADTIYGEFNSSHKKSDIVLDGGIIYQSLTAGNIGNTPASSPANWLATNLDSLRIKSFIWAVEDNALSALSLNRMLIENQYIYNLNIYETLKTLDGDYAAWVFEPKGSDYVTIRINQIAFQANTDVAQSLYVINQGRLIHTLELNPVNGKLVFEQIGYTFSGKGQFLFVVDSQEVLTSGVYNDPLKYDGFICYPATGIGDTAEDAVYSVSSNANGLNFNISCFLDSTIYIDNNKVDLAKFYQTQFEYDFIRMLVHDSNNRFNIEERIQASNPELMAAESLDMNNNTVARKYNAELKRAIEVINKTFDRFLKKKQGLRTKRRVI